MDIPYERNIIMLFNELYLVQQRPSKALGAEIILLLKEQHEIFKENIEIEDLLKIKPENKKNKILELLYEYCEIDNMLNQITSWMCNQKRKKDSITENSDKDEMLSLL